MPREHETAEFCRWDKSRKACPKINRWVQMFCKTHGSCPKKYRKLMRSWDSLSQTFFEEIQGVHGAKTGFVPLSQAYSAGTRDT
jgi:hypothetical protein